MSDAAIPDRDTRAVSRRDFGRNLATGAVAAALLPHEVALADDQKKPAKPDDATKQKSEDAKPLAPADLLLELIREQYSDERLDKAALADIRRDIEQQLSRSKTLSAFPLENGDEPGFAFGAYRAE
jgi:hypothetical protein